GAEYSTALSQFPSSKYFLHAGDRRSAGKRKVIPNGSSLAAVRISANLPSGPTVKTLRFLSNSAISCCALGSLSILATARMLARRLSAALISSRGDAASADCERTSATTRTNQHRYFIQISPSKIIHPYSGDSVK